MNVDTGYERAATRRGRVPYHAWTIFLEAGSGYPAVASAPLGLDAMKAGVHPGKCIPDGFHMCSDRVGFHDDIGSLHEIPVAPDLARMNAQFLQDPEMRKRQVDFAALPEHS